MQSLAGRVALVSGAVRPPRIGAATIWRLCELGAAVVCADDVTSKEHPDRADTAKTSRAELEELVRQLREAGHAAIPLVLDPTDGVAAESAVEAAVHEFGRLDICCYLGGGTSVSRATAPCSTSTSPSGVPLWISTSRRRGCWIGRRLAGW